MIERKWNPENHKLGDAFFPVELCDLKIKDDTREYYGQFGANAYAAMNVLTDFASYPQGLSDGGTGGLLDDVLPDAKRTAVFAGRVREARCRWFRDDQGGPQHRGRVQDPGLVPEDARRRAEVSFWGFLR